MKKAFFLIILFILPLPAVCALKVGDNAPDYTLPDIRTNAPVTLSSFRGQVVVMQIWKTN
jgi:hypothetical protein